jgi:hypothetical protein
MKTKIFTENGERRTEKPFPRSPFLLSPRMDAPTPLNLF